MTCVGGTASNGRCAIMADEPRASCPSPTASPGALRLPETFIAEPRIRAQRAQGNLFRTLLDLDLVNPDGSPAMQAQELLRLVPGVRRSDTDPQDKTLCAHVPFQRRGSVSPEETDGQQPSDAAGDRCRE